MNITAGMGAIEDYEMLVDAGADEVFCGFVPFEWNVRYGNLMPLNRREVMNYHVQINSWEDMKLLARMMKYRHVPAVITLNALYYTSDQLEWIGEYILRLTELGFGEYIIADIGLVMYLKEHDIPCRIHMSGELGEWNENTVRLTNDIYQCKRIIFHRKNSLEDMQSIIADCKAENMEYEAFLMNEMCHFTGGFCNSLHCDEMVHICQLPYRLSPVGCKDIPAIWQDGDEVRECIGDTGCGLCALWKLQEAGVSHLKIVGRGRSPMACAADIRAVKRALSIMETSLTEDTYKQQMKQELFPKGCSMQCYY